MTLLLSNHDHPALACIYLSDNLGVAADKLPSDARLAKETVVNVFRMAPECRTRDEMQLAIQPILFVLSRLKDHDADRVLLDLLSYGVGGRAAGTSHRHPPAGLSNPTSLDEGILQANHGIPYWQRGGHGASGDW